MVLSRSTRSAPLLRLYKKEREREREGGWKKEKERKSATGSFCLAGTVFLGVSAEIAAFSCVIKSDRVFRCPVSGRRRGERKRNKRTDKIIYRRCCRRVCSSLIKRPR